jgi:Uma2 family endonuclease
MAIAPQASRSRRYDEAMAATATASVNVAGSATALPIHRLDLATYNQIVASGALEGRHVELLDGLVVQMRPQSPAHATLIARLTGHFAAATRWQTRVQLPIEVAPDSEPEPDVAVLTHGTDPMRHPRTALLVVEVAVSSQAIDREVKSRLYARAGIPTYWLVDLPAHAVEIHTHPRGERYTHCERMGGDTLLTCPLDGVDDLPLATLFKGLGG